MEGAAMNSNDELDRAYALLVHLCEQFATMTDTALLCIMDAFSILAELHVPDSLATIEELSATQTLIDVRRRLTGLAAGTDDLSEALALTRARDLVSAAICEHP